MKLYFSPNACSLAPHIVLRECGNNFEIEKVDLQKKTTASGEDFLKINPKGYVPTLKLDNGEILTEANAILQYLADTFPQAKLAPAAGTFERYRLQEWLNFIATEMHKGLGVFFKPNVPEEYKKMVLEVLHKRFDFLENHLAKQKYLLGNTFSVADAYLFTVLRWTHYFKIDLNPWPSIAKFMNEMNIHPSVQAALAAEAASK
jgi:glutathione S-transferase